MRIEALALSLAGALRILASASAIENGRGQDRSPCDRACLIGVMDQYRSAFLKPTGMEIFEAFKIRNGKILEVAAEGGFLPFGINSGWESAPGELLP